MTPICTILELPPAKRAEADAYAMSVRPENQRMHGQGPAARAAVVISKWWGTGGCHLTVGFMDAGVSTQTKDNVLAWMNEWALPTPAVPQGANVSFKWSQDNPDIRIRFTRANTCAIGTDLRFVPYDQPNMTLVNDPNLKQYVQHEVFHGMGMYPHAHQLRGTVEAIDPQKAYAFYGAPPYRYNKAMVDGNVLETSYTDPQLYQTPPDRNSISSYWIPDEIIKPGYPPIHGGRAITPLDYQLIGTIYPKSTPMPGVITTKAQWDDLKRRGLAFRTFFESGNLSSVDVYLKPEANTQMSFKFVIKRVDGNNQEHDFEESDVVTVLPGKVKNPGAIPNPRGRYNAYVSLADGTPIDGKQYGV